jgi:GH15 family glucan-1,4-alpha-glucosidase
LGGSFAISPLKDFVSSQRYIEGTNVLQTVFETDSGRIRLNDFMPVGRLAGDYKESPPVTRRSISRLIEGLNGEVEIRVNFRPTFNYARSKTEIEPLAKGGGVARAADETVVLYCPFALNAKADGSLRCRANISKGDRVWLHLSYSRQSIINLQDLTPATHELEFEQAIVHWPISRIKERLSVNGLVYRYLTDDGLPGSEAAFGICSFWLVDNLALAGQIEEARDLFERLTGDAGHLQLFSEQIEPESREFLGNYPQGFTHLALIRSAFHIVSGPGGGVQRA